MKAKQLIEWVSKQTQPMFNLHTLEVETENIATASELYVYFEMLFCGQPIGKVRAGYYVYMDFWVEDYQENRRIFADKEPDFVIIVADIAICFHLMEDI